MKTTSMALALCAFLLAGACSKDETRSASARTGEPAAVTQQSDLTPEQLGELGAQIQKNPNEAQRLLTERGLDEQKFEQAVRKVSEDPAASRRYADAYKKAGA
jgi:ABC-type enterochelin transport system substrate-binding protein